MFQFHVLPSSHLSVYEFFCSDQIAAPENCTERWQLFPLQQEIRSAEAHFCYGSMNTKLLPPSPVAVEAVKSVILASRWSCIFQRAMSVNFPDDVYFSGCVVWKPHSYAHQLKNAMSGVFGCVWVWTNHPAPASAHWEWSLFQTCTSTHIWFQGATVDLQVTVKQASSLTSTLEDRGQFFSLPTPNQRGHSKSPFTPLIPKLNLMKILSCGISPNASELLAPGSLKEFA